MELPHFKITIIAFLRAICNIKYSIEDQWNLNGEVLVDRVGIIIDMDRLIFQLPLEAKLYNEVTAYNLLTVIFDSLSTCEFIMQKFLLDVRL